MIAGGREWPGHNAGPCLGRFRGKLTARKTRGGGSPLLSVSDSRFAAVRIQIDSRFASMQSGSEPWPRLRLGASHAASFFYEFIINTKIPGTDFSSRSIPISLCRSSLLRQSHVFSDQWPPPEPRRQPAADGRRRRRTTATCCRF